MVAAGALGACSTAPQGLPPVAVVAAGETTPVGTMNEDAADDPAIWRNAADPTASLIVATDKKGGLYVYNLDGEIRSFLDYGVGLNNVDLLTLPDGRVIVAASDRSDLAMVHILLAELDTAAGTLTQIVRIPVGPGEGYGICKGAVNDDGSFVIYNAPKEGAIYRTDLHYINGQWTYRTETLQQVPSQPEGCIYDERTGTLYIGEEVGGIWAMPGEGAIGDKVMVAPVDNQHIVADLEGLAIAPQGDVGGYLVGSSQGDNAYAVFRLPTMEPLGRFRIAEGTFGATQETDGIELVAQPMGPDFPAGLFVAQDGQNGAEAQNFKLVSWADVLTALKLH